MSLERTFAIIKPDAVSRSQQGEILSRRYVKVAPPTVHAGVGNALRQAFRMDGQIRSLKPFEDLLRQLD